MRGSRSARDPTRATELQLTGLIRPCPEGRGRGTWQASASQKMKLDRLQRTSAFRSIRLFQFISPHVSPNFVTSLQYETDNCRRAFRTNFLRNRNSCYKPCVAAPSRSDFRIEARPSVGFAQACKKQAHQDVNHRFWRARAWNQCLDCPKA